MQRESGLWEKALAGHSTAWNFGSKTYLNKVRHTLSYAVCMIANKVRNTLSCRGVERDCYEAWRTIPLSSPACCSC